MEDLLKEFSTWPDSDFFSKGAFITSWKEGKVIFGKGGNFCITHEIKSNSNTFYLKDFFEDTYLAYTPEFLIEIPKDLAQKTFGEAPLLPVTFVTEGTEDDLYQNDFDILKGSLDDNLRKVVLVSRANYRGPTGRERVQLLLNKAFTFEKGLPYGIWNEEYGVIGCTPEILYAINENKLETFALAGTAPAEKKDNLLDSIKDHEEHILVIKDIEEKVKDFALEVKSDKMKVEVFKDLAHLKTDIFATLKNNISLTELTNHLSPTAALGGYPKRESINFLKETQYAKKYKNRFFGSPFGFVSDSVKQFVVSIRNIQWEGDKTYIESGSGIIKKSTYENEMREILLKRESIQKHYL